MVASIAHSTRADGDLSPAQVAPDVLDERRQACVSHPWHVTRQVHSDRVVQVYAGSAYRPVADALVTAESNVALAVHSGDCVPVGFVCEAGAVAAAHAGWKGLELGILESTTRQLRQLGSNAAIHAVVGPHIRSYRYEFGKADLERLAHRCGKNVIARTHDDKPALDLTSAIANELARLDVQVAAWSSDCTAEDADRYWSHRARQEPGRIALVAWIEEQAA